MSDKSSKKTTSKELSTYLEKNVLCTPLARELYGYAKKGQPVLLHGNDTGDRFSLLHMPHHALHHDKEVGVLCVTFDYVFKGEIPKDCEPRSVYTEYLIPEMKKAIEDGDYKRIFRLIDGSRYPPNIIRNIDCENEDGKTVFRKLTDVITFTEDKLVDYIHSLSEEDKPLYSISGRNEPLWSDFEKIFRLSPRSKEFVNKPSTYCYRYEGSLSDPGTLFVDNLRCVKDDPEDIKYYEKLASFIQGRIQSQWLVVYAYDHKTFPPQFLKQFKTVSLDSNCHEAEDQEGNQAEGRGIKSKVDLPQSKSQGTLKDKIPSGTKWTHIEMSLTDKEYKSLEISVKGGKPFTVNSHTLGLESDHSHKPLKAWWVLLAFAKAGNNEIPTTGKKLSEFAVKVETFIPTDGKVLFSHIKILREKLSSSFGISENTITYSEEKKVYETSFRINDNSYTEEYRKSTQKMENTTCVECNRNINKPDHNNLDDEGYYICDKCRGANHNRISKENTYKNYPDKDE
ncbi:MAG: hypothetical protein HOI47_18715 [Candidatus Scalindua sp.]|jgi:hypothetical protein|nr:hypothetical protein [Candidatus Scalindua sp.]MBT6228679.1 hypothetical protein [Candidatus Scalindua sp.]